ncbi:hypothetical protein XENOCAPTIV_003387 [Xenoophorus captivus]|uniref:NHR2-like domain-containing protein n=1 Tax=Xenoophorus captivus TaxID=1517983 RepID=A0ABV0S1E3_9TELE
MTSCNLSADSREKKTPAMPGSPVDAKTHSRSAPSSSASSTMPPLPSVNPSGPRPASFSTTACKKTSKVSLHFLSLIASTRLVSSTSNFICIPKANLPLLQRELLHCARAAKQTPAQYLSQHEHLLLSTTMTSSPDSSELLMEPPEAGTKRHSPSRVKENGFHERPPVAMEPAAKRICTISPAPRHSPAHPLPLTAQLHPTPPPLQHYALDDIAAPHLLHREHSQRVLEIRELKDRPRLPGTNGGYREEPVDHRLTDREWADEWRHLDHVLNCIVDMVEKTRRSVSVLRRCQESDREELNYWRRRLSEQEDPRKGASGSAPFSKTHSPLSAESGKFLYVL